MGTINSLQNYDPNEIPDPGTNAPDESGSNFVDGLIESLHWYNQWRMNEPCSFDLGDALDYLFQNGESDCGESYCALHQPTVLAVFDATKKGLV
jgi:hypothetical protein